MPTRKKSTSNSANILGIGIAAVDIINETTTYPEEDAEVRSLAQTVRRGGNVTNTLVVLSQLGHHCQWIGTIADDLDSEVIRRDLNEHGINFSMTQQLSNYNTPTSYIILNQKNGSRTIVHYRDLPELSAAHFEKQNLGMLDWIHMEGRNVNETMSIIEKIKKNYPDAITSIEIEKERDDIEKILNQTDITFFSKHFANQRNFSNANTFLKHMRTLSPSSLLLCTWGDTGAFAMEEELIYFAPAPKIDTVIDSTGAGDVFNAAIIAAKIKGFDTQQCLEYACTISAKKCGQHGINNLFDH